MVSAAGDRLPRRPASPSASRVRERARQRCCAARHPRPSRAKQAMPAVVETAESLLAAADAARLQGRAQEGAALLRRILNNHRSDPRAPLAAFTLGRVLLMELGQPRQAAAAFADARALAPGGPFAEDALAREVEAWAKAGTRRRRARAPATTCVPTRAVSAPPRCARSAAASERADTVARGAGGAARGRARDARRCAGVRGARDRRAGHGGLPGDLRRRRSVASSASRSAICWRRRATRLRRAATGWR